MMVKVSGITAPAPIPWIRRKSTSWPMFRLNPHRAEPAMNVRTPAKNRGLRPCRSDNLPQRGMVTVEERRYPEKTQLYIARPPKLETTVGMAVAMAVASRADKNSPSMMPARTNHL